MFGPGGKGFGGEGGDFANSTQKMGSCGILAIAVRKTCLAVKSGLGQG